MMVACWVCWNRVWSTIYVMLFYGIFLNLLCFPNEPNNNKIWRMRKFLFWETLKQLLSALVWPFITWICFEHSIIIVDLNVNLLCVLKTFLRYFWWWNLCVSLEGAADELFIFRSFFFFSLFCCPSSSLSYLLPKKLPPVLWGCVCVCMCRQKENVKRIFQIFKTRQKQKWTSYLLLLIRFLLFFCVYFHEIFFRFLFIHFLLLYAPRVSSVFVFVFCLLISFKDLSKEGRIAKEWNQNKTHCFTSLHGEREKVLKQSMRSGFTFFCFWI